MEQIFEQEIIAKYTSNSSEAQQSLLSKSALNIKCQQTSYELLHLLRVQHASLQKTLSLTINQLFCQNENIKFDKPQKFDLLKISDNQTYSRNITICISGFTSEDEDQSIKWQSIVQKYPDMEVYSLQYKSQTVQESI